MVFAQELAQSGATRQREQREEELENWFSSNGFRRSRNCVCHRERRWQIREHQSAPRDVVPVRAFRRAAGQSHAAERKYSQTQSNANKEFRHGTAGNLAVPPDEAKDESRVESVKLNVTCSLLLGFQVVSVTMAGQLTAHRGLLPMLWILPTGNDAR
jgi:hypothetical protein